MQAPPGILWVALAALAALAGCRAAPHSGGEALLEKYATVPLCADLDGLTASQREMLAKLQEAAAIMDELFWQQAFGDRTALLASINDPALRRFAEINYGPWDRLDGNAPFLDGFGPKPPGARFYPRDTAPPRAWPSTTAYGATSNSALMPC